MLTLLIGLVRTFQVLGIGSYFLFSLSLPSYTSLRAPTRYHIQSHRGWRDIYPLNDFALGPVKILGGGERSRGWITGFPRNNSQKKPNEHRKNLEEVGSASE